MTTSTELPPAGAFLVLWKIRKVSFASVRKVRYHLPMATITEIEVHDLFDAATDECIGQATTEQVTASDLAEKRGKEGIIMIDKNGKVVTEAAPGNRLVYTYEAGTCRTACGCRIKTNDGHHDDPECPLF